MNENLEIMRQKRIIILDSIDENSRIKEQAEIAIKRNKLELETLEAMIWNLPESEAGRRRIAAEEKEAARMDISIKYLANCGFQDRNGSPYDYSIFNSKTGCIIKNSEKGI